MTDAGENALVRRMVCAPSEWAMETVLADAQRQYLNDPEFHAIVYKAVQMALPIASDTTEAATIATSVAMAVGLRILVDRSPTPGRVDE